jgi:hypothetical protein
VASDDRPRLRLVQPFRQRFDFVLYDHGLAAYEKCGCRCEVCESAKAEVLARKYPPYRPPAAPGEPSGLPSVCRDWDCERPPVVGGEYCRLHQP